VAPLADCLCDIVHGDAEQATDAILALPGVEQLGGSRAQREVVEDTLLYAAVQAGRVDVAGQLLNRRLDWRDAPRDRKPRAHLRDDLAALKAPPTTDGYV
jgi:hypothetical protein